MPFKPVSLKPGNYYLDFIYKGKKIVLIASGGFKYPNGDEDWYLSTKKNFISITWNKGSGKIKVVVSSRPVPGDFLEAVKKEFEAR